MTTLNGTKILVLTSQEGVEKAELEQPLAAIREAGGTVNADHVRADAASVALVTAFVEAAVLPGKTLTSYPSLRTDITNAGGAWVDENVVHCPGNGWDLITSRNPDDLTAFNATIIEVVRARGPRL